MLSQKENLDYDKAENFKDESNKNYINYFLGLIFKWWWFMMIAALVLAVGGYCYSVVSYIPTYTAKGTMIVSPNITGSDQTPTTGELTLARQLANSYTHILKSGNMTERIIQKLSLTNKTSKQLQSEITIKAVEDTVLINIFVKSNDSKYSWKVANTLMELAPETIESTIDVGRVNILDDAKEPNSPDANNKAKNYACIGIAIGLILSMGIVMIIEFMRDTVKNNEELYTRFGLPTLGVIPLCKNFTIEKENKNDSILEGEEVKNKKEKKSKKANRSEKTPIIISKKINPKYIESYKTMRTKIEMISLSRNLKTFVVTSSVGEEGKTSVTINLCIALAKKGKKVLLIDADLRRPTVDKKLGVKYDKKKGLTAVLHGKVPLNNCIYYNEMLGIYCLFSGVQTTSSSELLGSNQMKELIEYTKTQFDYIIFDSPPTYILTDSAALASMTDGIFMVVRHDKISKNVIAHSLEDLYSSETPILGFILNMVKEGIGGIVYGKRDFYRKNYYYSKEFY